jgi:hypothetical protein
MNVIAVILGLLGVVLVAAGEVLDYREFRYGRPPRLPLRWNFLGACAGLLAVTAAVVVALIDHYR